MSHQTVGRTLPEEIPLLIEETPYQTQETPPMTDETPLQSEETPPMTEETPLQSEETPLIVIEETPLIKNLQWIS